MKTNAKTLALRDPALALLVGALVASDFGGERGVEASSDFGNDFDFGDDYGFEFGDDWGADAAGALTPASAPLAVSRPSQAQVASLWNKMRAEASHTQRRAMLLEPNKNSRIKVERYTFAVNQQVAIGTDEALDMSGNPDVNIRPQRVTINAPVPGFATISDIKVANVSVGVGGTLDAYQFNANGVGQTLDMPTLSPANRARVTGNYTGITPTGYTAAAAFLIVASFTGPASIVA